MVYGDLPLERSVFHAVSFDAVGRGEFRVGGITTSNVSFTLSRRTRIVKVEGWFVSITVLELRDLETAYEQ